MKKKIIVAPSLLSADFARLGEDAKRMQDAQADMLHIDIMDGHFVSNITIGPKVVAAIKKSTNLPLDVHLMISEPKKYAKNFIDAGADIVTFHIEVEPEPAGLIEEIKRLNARPGIVLNPPTPLKKIEKTLNLLDFILVMSVNPGFAGQSFIDSTLSKIKELRSKFDKDIEVDGGITKETAKPVVEAGANVLVAGTYVFGAKNPKEAIESLRNVA